jgi:serine/threonine-protein kinase
MGEVYRARDSRLDRHVALKILPATLGGDPERLARFRREAQVLASLNHPHIAAIYGLEEAGGRLALALELVDGEGLEARLARGPVPMDEAIAIARQIAEALEHAHDSGIVHRDLKPANVRLTAHGTVKLLDFGLAKALEEESTKQAHASDSPTLTRHGTEAGLILGTAAYMSPEQARGKPVDKRTDIWAFGVVLYEMLTGRALFGADTVSDTLAAVLTREPDFSALSATTPHALRALLRRCLERDPKVRLRDIGEARIVLSAPDAGSESAAGAPAIAAPPTTWWRRPEFWVALVIIAFAAVLFGLQARQRTEPTAAPLLTVGIDAGGDTPLAGVGWIGLHWVGPTAVLSPDGAMLAFIARGPSGGRWQLYSRRLDELKAAPLPGTDGAVAPFFAPDGRAIAFFSGGHLKKVALNDGTVTTICPAEEPRGGAWADDGTILFAPRPEGPLYRVPSEGGTPTPATTLDAAAGEVTHRWPQALPGGKTFLFTAHTQATASRSGTIVAWSSADGRRTVVHPTGLFGRYARSGHLLYMHDGKLFAVTFDVEALQVTGRPVAIVDQVAHALINGTAQFSLSDTGLLAYRRARGTNRLLQWMDLAGQLQPLRAVPADYQEVRFSEDGTRLLLVIGEAAQSDVWIYDMARETMTRLTFHSDNDWSPIWSPDGRHIVYASWRSDVGTFNLFLHRTDGTGEPVRLTSNRNHQLPIEWHPGGRHLLFAETRQNSGQDLMLLPLERTADGGWKPGAPTPLLATAANELAGEFSPDGKWMAYTSDESGRSEVYVQPFPGPGGRWQVSTEGAEWVEWRANDQLLYGRSEEVVMAVPYRVEGRTFAAGKPRVWMRIPPGVSWVDPAPDSPRAAVIRSEDPRRESMVLVVNFFEHLRRVAR